LFCTLAVTGLWVGRKVSVGKCNEVLWVMQEKTRMKILAAVSLLLLFAGLGAWFFAEQLAAYFSG
jgi:hypothetical protein